MGKISLIPKRKIQRIPGVRPYTDHVTQISEGHARSKLLLSLFSDPKPTAGVGYRRYFVYELGGATTADKIYSCMKDSTGSYSWVQIAIG